MAYRRLEFPGNAMTAPNTPESNQPAKSDKSCTSPRQSLAASRLRKHADYQRAYAASRKRQSASMSWFLAPRAESVAHSDKVQPGQTAGRVGLTAGKVLGKAHERNRIKRRMREVLRRHLDLLPEGADLILHPRRTVLTMDFVKLDEEVVRILTQARADATKFATRQPVVLPA